MVKFPIEKIIIEGPDLAGKTTLFNKMHEISKFRWNIQDRSALSMLIYAKMYDRDTFHLIENLKKEAIIESKIKAESEIFNKKSQLITIIVAAAENDVIGIDNKLIWHLSNDLKRFKELTKGHHVIMGRKTFESMPRALPNRTNIVITRKKDYLAENAIVTNSLSDAISISSEDSQPFIIGGGEIYKMALNISDRIELTRVHHNFDGDTYFPEIDAKIWRETNRIEKKKDDNHKYNYTFITYEKIK